MTTNHNLKHNGAAYNDAAALINPDPKVTSGAGRALCTCGILSEELPSGGARRAWHKAHKAQPTPEPVQDVEPGTPEDEVAEALAELVEPAPKAARATRQTARAELLEERKAKKARKAKETPGVDDAASERNAASQSLAFSTSGVVPGFWRSLGRDAVKTAVDELHPTVVVTPNNNSQTLHFQGPAEDVAAAVAMVQELWAEALKAVKTWKLEDPGFLGRSTEPLARRREGYHLTEAFYAGFGTTYVEWRKGQ
jgi:hypothetical protein